MNPKVNQKSAFRQVQKSYIDPMNMDQNANAHLLDLLHGFDSVGGDFEIQIEGRFEASHYLRAYFEDGSDEPLHGHSWKVEVVVSSKNGSVGPDGICYDFLAARKRLNELTDRLEHVVVNHLVEFQNVNPTSENICRWFFQGLNSVVREDGGVVREVRVHEGPFHVATFRPD